MTQALQVGHLQREPNFPPLPPPLLPLLPPGTRNDADAGAGPAAEDGPRLLLVSSEIKSFTMLHESVKTDTVRVIQYDHSNATLESLFAAVEDGVPAGGYRSIGLIAHGDPGALHLCGAPRSMYLSIHSLTDGDDPSAALFFRSLVGLISGPARRLDLLATNAAGGEEGSVLQDTLEELLDVPVFLSTHAAPDENEESHGGSCIDDVSVQYFAAEKIGQWVGPHTQTLAEYEKVCIVGKGAFGSAVLYRKRDDGMYVVLKAVDMHQLETYERQLALNEHVVLGTLDHINIIRYYDSFEENDTLQIEMEYADGGTLAQFLCNRNGVEVPEPQIVTIFRQMVDATAYIHSKQILHRDLKTQNIFLTMEGIVKVGDFGIAKQLNESKTKAHTLLGTPNYISPELCQGLPYDDKSDIWSLGCILYEMIMLRKPFEGSNLPALVEKIVNGDIDPLPDSYSVALHKVIDQMLQREPKDRPDAASILASPLCVDDLSEADDVGQLGATQVLPSDVQSSVFYWAANASIPRQFTFDTQITVTEVAVGNAHGVALTGEGLVFSWGSNSHGQLGHGDLLTRTEPQVVAAILNKPTRKIACGGDVTALLSTTGLFQLCGRGEFGCLGNGELQDKHLPYLIQAMIMVEVTDISVGAFHAAAITADPPQLYTWGLPHKGRLGLGTAVQALYPAPQLVDLGGVCVPVKVSCGLDGTMVQSDSLALFATGNNEKNKLGLNSRPSILRTRASLRGKAIDTAWSFTRVASIGKCEVAGMSAGASFGAAVTNTGSCFMFGSNAVGGLGCGDTKERKGSYTTVKSVLASYRVIDVTCGETFTVVKASGKRNSQNRSAGPIKPSRVFAWGRGMADRCEKLANDDQTSIYLPSELGLTENVALQEVTSIAAHRDALIVAIKSASPPTAMAGTGTQAITGKLGSDYGQIGTGKVTLISTESQMTTRNAPDLVRNRSLSMISVADNEDMCSNSSDDDGNSDSMDHTPRWLRDEFVAAVSGEQAAALATTDGTGQTAMPPMTPRSTVVAAAQAAVAKAAAVTATATSAAASSRDTSVVPSFNPPPLGPLVEGPFSRHATLTGRAVLGDATSLTSSQKSLTILSDTNVPLLRSSSSAVQAALESQADLDGVGRTTSGPALDTLVRPSTAPHPLRPVTWHLNHFPPPSRPTIRHVPSLNCDVKVDLDALLEFANDRSRPDQAHRGSYGGQPLIKSELDRHRSLSTSVVYSSIPKNFIFEDKSDLASSNLGSVVDSVADSEPDEHTQWGMQLKIDSLQQSLSDTKNELAAADRQIKSLTKQLEASEAQHKTRGPDPATVGRGGGAQSSTCVLL